MSRPASLAAVTVALLMAGTSGRAQPLIDIANDTNDPQHLPDTEPSIAVNPVNPSEISIVTFAEGWSAGAGAPVRKSRDGGATWSKVPQLPQPATGSPAPADQKLAYDAAGRLYAAELMGNLSKPDCTVLRQAAGADTPMTPGAFYGDDQPHLDIDRSAASGFLRRLYSPWLDLSAVPQRSTVSFSTDFGVTMTDAGAGDNSSFPNRTTRIAVAPDGRAYVVYKTREGAVDAFFENAHFRVNRSGMTWGALGAAGVSVHGAAAVETWFTEAFGNHAKGKVNRARSSDAWIAADPATGDVYVAHVRKDGSTFGQVYVARSSDHGVSWTSSRVTDGTHHAAFPEIAATANRAVGVLYVDYDDSGPTTLFRHHFAISQDLGASWSDEVQQAFDPGPIANATDGFIWGDYEGLAAAGHVFYGVFTGQSIGRATPEMDPIFFQRSANGCNPPCAGGLTCCTASCVDLTSDPNNCGKCGKSCSQNETCNNGTCKSLCRSCPRGTVCCPGPGGDVGCRKPTECQ